MTSLTFTVLGRPQPGGSKKPVRAGGKPDGRIILKEDAKKSKPWRALVAAAALDALMASGDNAALLFPAGPLVLEVDFYLARPASHFGSGRNAGRVRESAPRYPTVRPDSTKLIRALEDALTGLVWRDDAQVVTQVVRKRYGTPERAEVLIEPVVVTLDEVTERLMAPEPPQSIFNSDDLEWLFSEDES